MSVTVAPDDHNTTTSLGPVNKRGNKLLMSSFHDAANTAHNTCLLTVPIYIVEKVWVNTINIFYWLKQALILICTKYI